MEKRYQEKGLDKKDIEELKKEYEKLKEKYNLPDFRQLAEDFDIEKITDKELGSFILRDIRRAVDEKISAYLHLFENLVNPALAPVFLFSFLKNVDEEERKKIKEVYKALSKMQLESIKIDTIYNENSEADFIKNIFKEWQSLKKEIHRIIEKFDKSLEESNNSNKTEYFG